MAAKNMKMSIQIKKKRDLSRQGKARRGIWVVNRWVYTEISQVMTTTTTNKMAIRYIRDSDSSQARLLE